MLTRRGLFSGLASLAALIGLGRLAEAISPEPVMPAWMADPAEIQAMSDRLVAALTQDADDRAFPHYSLGFEPARGVPFGPTPAEQASIDFVSKHWKDGGGRLV